MRIWGMLYYNQLDVEKHGNYIGGFFILRLPRELILLPTMPLPRVPVTPKMPACESGFYHCIGVRV